MALQPLHPGELALTGRGTGGEAINEARIWNRLARSYDQTVRLFDRSYPRVRELLRVDLANHEHVLEVAAGTGQFTFDLAQTAHRLTATDVSSEMVRQLRAAIAARDADNITTAVMSAYELDVADGSVDGIFCANALHVMETPQRALREFRRALRPGGRLVIPTFCHGVDNGRRLLSWLLGIVTPFVAYTRFSLRSLRQMVAAEGFAVTDPILLPGLFPIAYLVADRPEEPPGR